VVLLVFPVISALTVFLAADPPRLFGLGAGGRLMSIAFLQEFYRGLLPPGLGGSGTITVYLLRSVLLLGAAPAILSWCHRRSSALLPAADPASPPGVARAWPPLGTPLLVVAAALAIGAALLVVSMGGESDVAPRGPALAEADLLSEGEWIGEEGDEPIAANERAHTGERSEPPSRPAEPLIVATGRKLPPLFDTTTDPPSGFDLDVARELGRRFQRPDVRFVGGSKVRKRVSDGEADIGIAAISITQARERENLYSEPYLRPRVRLYVPSGRTDPLPADIGSVRCAPGHAVYTARVRDSGCVLAKGGSLAAAKQSVADGTADGMVMDEIEAAGVPGWRDSGLSFGSDRYGIAMRLGDFEMKAAVDSELKAMRADGTLDRLLARYGLRSPDDAAPESAARAGKAVVGASLGEDCETLWRARNWVFARHGYAFGTAKARNFFSAQRGYSRDEAVNAKTIEALLTAVDQSNRELLVDREREIGCR
jgi:ABC-type amino acid transport substrate-binding protein